MSNKQSQRPTVFLAIDPGAIGGIAILCGSSALAITAPRSLKTLWDFITHWANPASSVVAGIEQVGGYVKDNPTPGSAMFEFGRNFGQNEMALVGHGFSITKAGPGLGDLYFVPPQKWQGGLGIDPKRKSEDDTAWKNRLKWNAENLFPKDRYRDLKITLRTADALLLALYIKKEYQGIL